MRRCTLIPFALLLALVAAFVWTPAAEAVGSCNAAVGMEVAPAAVQDADFLATLADVPSPKLASTTCTDHSQCPTGQLCCYPCGIDGCDKICMTPVRGRCPFFP